MRRATLLVLAFTACKGATGDPGAAGLAGAPGQIGQRGPTGQPGPTTGTMAFDTSTFPTGVASVTSSAVTVSVQNLVALTGGATYQVLVTDTHSSTAVGLGKFNISADGTKLDLLDAAGQTPLEQSGLIGQFATPTGLDPTTLVGHGVVTVAVDAPNGADGSVKILTGQLSATDGNPLAFPADLSRANATVTVTQNADGVAANTQNLVILDFEHLAPLKSFGFGYTAWYVEYKAGVPTWTALPQGGPQDSNASGTGPSVFSVAPKGVDFSGIEAVAITLEPNPDVASAPNTDAATPFFLRPGWWLNKPNAVKPVRAVSGSLFGKLGQVAAFVGPVEHPATTMGGTPTWDTKLTQVTLDLSLKISQGFFGTSIDGGVLFPLASKDKGGDGSLYGLWAVLTPVPADPSKNKWIQLGLFNTEVDLASTTGDPTKAIDVWDGTKLVRHAGSMYTFGEVGLEGGTGTFAPLDLAALASTFDSSSGDITTLGGYLAVTIEPPGKAMIAHDKRIYLLSTMAASTDSTICVSPVAVADAPPACLAQADGNGNSWKLAVPTTSSQNIPAEGKQPLQLSPISYSLSGPTLTLENFTTTEVEDGHVAIEAVGLPNLKPYGLRYHAWLADTGATFDQWTFSPLGAFDAAVEATGGGTQYVTKQSWDSTFSATFSDLFLMTVEPEPTSVNWPGATGPGTAPFAPSGPFAASMK